MAANGDAAIKRAARRGHTWYVNPHATYTSIKQQIELYHEIADSAGSGAPQGLPIARELYVGETREQAWAEAAPFISGKYAAYAQWGQDKQ